MSDDLLTTTLLATRAPVLVAPAMNPAMYAHPATQHNLAILRERGYTILDPDVGRMAEPQIGQGRLPEPPALEGALRAMLGRRTGQLRDVQVVISAGGTREPIDPVRYIGNRSSGQMGYALAACARDMGASVTLVSGPTALPVPEAVTVVPVETALEMRDAVHAACATADVLIMNAAVADFRTAQESDQKIKKQGDGGLILELVPNPDIIAELAERTDLFKVGFAAETQSLLEHARQKLERKGMHLIVANDAVASIGRPTISLTLLDAVGTHALPEQPKPDAAALLLEQIAMRYRAWRDQSLA
jgi:phosphopantothenoylcysteine decarboxylase/phosphopantothenate--cysteine ligase